MNFFKRFFKTIETKTNSILDNLEIPISFIEESIKNLKSEIKKNREVLAEIKVLSIRAKNEAEKFEKNSYDYEQKAILILQKGQQKTLSIIEADQLAVEALQKKALQIKLSKKAKSEHNHFEKKYTQLNKNIYIIKSTISKWENKLKILNGRIKISTATKNLNKQLALLNSNNTITLLNKLRDEVIQEEALLKSYQDLTKVHYPINLDNNLKANHTQEDLNTLKQKISINKTK